MIHSSRERGEMAHYQQTTEELGQVVLIKKMGRVVLEVASPRRTTLATLLFAVFIVAGSRHCLKQPTGALILNLESWHETSSSLDTDTKLSISNCSFLAKELY
jgi:hypothetical protein